ncbi:hypothetical protein JKF63_03247 [Porcisia hertigi]|uniref:Uncharacterized protein n=1 Tax=Porcisia hertigi TaxID=2761500 RepID=A0A836HYB4_9TRYP|nr:hypothetical protein JKF63_03247 [Porcisia hertigi]
MQCSTRRSQSMSSRLSEAGSAAPPTVADLNRLRRRLHQSGALMSSRSAVSRANVDIDFEVVNVGEGRCATLVEHLLARLEQHGLRRRLVSEDDAAAYAVDVAARADTEGTSDDDTDEENVSEKLDNNNSRAATSRSSGVRALSPVASSRSLESREAYYYLCVPCELRLTRVSRRPPRWRAVEDVHFHFSSATHRATASWMADDDIDETLHTTPLITPLHYYSRIYINGIPTLLSRRPGGGDMFYPLPHEQDLVGSCSAPFGKETYRLADCEDFGAMSESSDASGALAKKLFPPLTLRGAQGGAPVLWHRALPSVYTGLVQLIRRARSTALAELPSDRRKYRLDRAKSRMMVAVDHCSLDEYRRQSWLPPQKVPLSPAVYRLHRERVPKPLLARREQASRHGQVTSLPSNGLAEQAADTGHRTVYAQPPLPIAEGTRDYHRQGDDITTTVPVSTTVFEDECYRVALRSAVDRAHQENLQRPDTSPQLNHRMTDADAASQEMTQPVLTLELLMHHTQATSQSWGPRNRSTASLSGSLVPSTALPPSSPPRPSGIRHRPRGGRPHSTSSSAVSEETLTSSSLTQTRKRVKREV